MHATRTLLAVLLLVCWPAPASGTVGDPGPYWAGITDNTRAAVRVTGEFVVPKVSDHCGASSDVAVWVGIGGWGVPFAQLGVTLTHGSMGAWYEMFGQDGNGPLVPFDYKLQPGDRIRLRLAFTDDHTQLLLVWNNLTEGNRVEKTLNHAGRWWNGGTAEWIVERHRPRLAQFAPITFDRAYYTDSTGTHDAIPADYREQIVNTDGKPLTKTTVSDGEATTRWLACS